MVILGKQLHHIVRLYQFILNLKYGLSFKKSLITFNDNIRAICIKAKLNKYNLDEARLLAREYADKVYDIKEELIADTLYKNDEVINILLDIKLNILKKYFIEQLEPKIIEPDNLCLDKYKKIWVTSDNHFGHNNILKYEDRLTKLKVSSLEEHDQELINRWNSLVTEDDLVLILGDFSFKNAKATEELLKTLKGDKILIKGNHDIFLEDKQFDKTLFRAIYDYKEIKFKNYELILMHYPIQNFKHMDRENPALLLFGHIHSFKLEIPKHSFNVGVDVNNYYPVDLITAISKALNNKGGIINNV